MSRLALAAGLLPLTALVACSAEASSDGSADEGVPAGVAEQYSVLAQEVAERGGQAKTGEWTVSYIVEAAEPWHEAHEGETHFRQPTAQETHHIEIIPTETATGRIVPDVPITLQVRDAEGKVVDEKQLQFLHSTFFHYANNFEVPEEGKYTLRATLGAPGFARHGEEGEQPALAEGAEVEFEDVELARE
ncbi:MAG TPA: iron transporter [Nocardioidaceae bacterium]|nr:iron transporter [Nocardioidaceae bacterium]